MKPLDSGALYSEILDTEKSFAILIDPDKTNASEAKSIIKRLPKQTTHLLVGGSSVKIGKTQTLVKALKQETNLPIILFPGDVSQITTEADAILFLSLLSGRNPEFLIEQHIKAIPKLKDTTLEIIPTGYILIDGGRETAVQHVSQTLPMPQEDAEAIVNTALAAQYSGKKLIYLEAGSGAKISVKPEIIKAVSEAVNIPVIVGGGIRNTATIQEVFQAGAKMVVVGTAFEAQQKL